jgi:hypothetical protein
MFFNFIYIEFLSMYLLLHIYYTTDIFKKFYILYNAAGWYGTMGPLSDTTESCFTVRVGQ